MNEKEKDQKIYLACEHVRVFVIVHAGSTLFKGGSNSQTSDIVNKIHKGSTINYLIQGSDWKTLFSNKDWLKLLEDAQNLNSLTNGSLTLQLKTIAEFFPQETKGYILPEILV